MERDYKLDNRNAIYFNGTGDYKRITRCRVPKRTRKRYIAQYGALTGTKQITKKSKGL